MTSLLGSELWTNEPRYHNEYRLRIHFVLNEVPPKVIHQLASSLRGGLSCVVSDTFSAGDFNLVKKITFVDNEQWVMRIRMPPLSFFRAGTPHGPVKCTDREIEALRSEVSTMQYIRSVPHETGFQQSLTFHLTPDTRRAFRFQGFTRIPSSRIRNLILSAFHT
jgi:hypothetical protein